MGAFEHIGYNVAKKGVVALTQGFKSSEPNIYESEGIKCYALAPWYADTNLVRSSLQLSNENPGKWTRGGKTVTSIQDLKLGKSMTRVLTVNEVGHALIKSLEYDKVTILVHFQVNFSSIFCLFWPFSNNPISFYILLCFILQNVFQFILVKTCSCYVLICSKAGKKAQ